MAAEAVAILREGTDAGRWTPSKKENQWLQKIEDAIAAMPDDDASMLREARETYGALFQDDSYGL